ncbi:50S ribosome-binding GTPase [Nocardioides sp. KIGAM211]|uniref:50S ribosome-binding GTPase n=1 Tax=Nocardioides luti TaxID=2761101 RepID=A0A7X0V9X8_9ACTN|nr:YfjP family GTPase [Nocardioides luti]MBB6626760.1 50S ribosome-binding GTPase [Nocardioides luti]
MTALLEGAKKLVTRGTDIGARIEGLDTATEAARGRLDDTVVDEARAVVDRASGRLRLSADHTVVAIAGATGSGKSSTFNALTGLELSAVGVRRPTTSWATACVWGAEGADELLEWLGIPPRHQTTRDSMLDTGREDKALQGVVLLDLPDHDSTEVSHHLEVDRLVQLADLLVWVLDPQKYADAAIHDRYLKPLASHEGVMLVVLNHIDTVPEDRRQGMVDDVRRLLAQDGLGKVPVLAVSARQGIGVDALREQIASRVSAKKMTKQRLEADLRTAATRLDEASGSARTRDVPKDRVAALDDAFAEAAGVPTVVDAVERSTRQRAGRATGWPVTSWFSKLKPDPLKRLHLALGAEGKQLTGRSRTSVPQATQVQRARVDTAVRSLADDVSGGLARPWADAVRRASISRLSDLGDRLDGALAETDLGATKIPAWAGAVRVVQWVLIVSALLGAVWLAGLAAMGYLQMPQPSTPRALGLPVPTLMLLGGVVLGVLLALVCRLLVSATARRRARAADRRLREAVRSVARELVVEPVEAELTAYATVRSGLARALK